MAKQPDSRIIIPPPSSAPEKEEEERWEEREEERTSEKLFFHELVKAVEGNVEVLAVMLACCSISIDNIPFQVEP